ncbi:MAG: Methyltransferase protein [Chloroflexota bacterium]|nr:Methyltransferase protein [Chloroflexota bacterium]
MAPCRGETRPRPCLALWGAMTAGCGRLPEPGKMVARLAAAGFVGLAAHGLIPGMSFHAFGGAHPGGARP